MQILQGLLVRAGGQLVGDVDPTARQLELGQGQGKGLRIGRWGGGRSLLVEGKGARLGISASRLS
jgi:hypothetical protein